LRIYTKDEHPHVISDHLNIKPSRICIAGQINVLGEKSHNGWFISTKGKIKSRDSRRHIDWILDKIEPETETILKLQKDGYSMDIMSYWGSATGNGGPTISPEQMSRLVRMNLSVWWDVYFEGEEEDEGDSEKDEV
jgi:hypothetical protein